jgi:hypothetical protein
MCPRDRRPRRLLRLSGFPRARRLGALGAALLGLGLALALTACAPDDDPAPGGAAASSALAQGAPEGLLAPVGSAPAADMPAPEPAQPAQGVSWDDSGPMTGAWHGSWVLYGHAAEGAVHIRLRHFDESFNGSIELDALDTLVLCGKTSGTIVWGLQFDDYVTFGFYDLYSYGLTFHGTLHGRTLSGQFLAVTECGAQAGTFQVSL